MDERRDLVPCPPVLGELDVDVSDDDGVIFTREQTREPRLARSRDKRREIVERRGAHAAPRSVM